jgi:DNA polymerase-3 subunit delta
MSAAPAGRSPADLLLIHGEESHLVDAEARAWLAAARSACLSDLNVEVVDSPTRLDQLRRGVAEVPFLDDRRYVLVRDPPQLSERVRRGSDAADTLVAVVTERAPTTSLCLVAHHRVAPAHPVLIAVQRSGGRVSSHVPLRGRELRDWVERRATQRGLRLPRPAVIHLVEVTGGDLGVLDGELAKLVSYADGRQRLEVDEIRAVASGDAQVRMWEVVDALLDDTPGRAAAMVDALLADGVATQQLVSVMAGQFRELLVAAELRAQGVTGAPALARELGLPPWRAERIARWLGRVDAATVHTWLRGLQRVDAQSKLGKTIDTDALRAVVLDAAGDRLATPRT